MRRFAPALVACIVLVALAVSGCGGGGGGGGKNLIASVAQTRAFYQILDLTNGTVTPTGTLSGLLTDPSYRTSKIVFRLIDDGSPTLGGGPGGFAADSDERLHATSLHRYYLAVFETTQAQWSAIGGSPAWLSLISAVSASDVQVGATYPAVGVTADAAATALGAYNRAHASHLRLPSEDEWEYACRAGSGGAYSWGNALDSTTVAARARVWETCGGARGAAIVGSLTPNAWGFYDMHGNAWELCADGVARGGSWNDPLSLARSANRLAIATGGGASTSALEPDSAHALVGVRLVYVP